LVLSTLSENELEALTLNQVSHFVLKHPEKRGGLIFILIIMTTLLGLLAMTIGQWSPIEQPLVEIVGSVISFVVFLGSFRLLFLQTQKHVAEGDLYTVEQMGVSCEVLTRTLRKLDLLAAPIPVDFSSISKVPVGFPETERRIKLLENSATVSSKENLDKVA
jgi:Zn-dependent protease with chaperone function